MNHLPHWIFALQVPSKNYDCGKTKNFFFFNFEMWQLVNAFLFSLYWLLDVELIYVSEDSTYFPCFTTKLV